MTAAAEMRERLADLGRRIRAAEKKHEAHIRSYTSRRMAAQFKDIGKAFGVVRIDVVDGTIGVSPMYPAAPKGGA